MATIPPYQQDPVAPFEIPQEQPILPAGESHSLPNSFFADAPTPPAPAPATLSLMQAPNEEQLAQIHSLFDAQDQVRILAWWSHIYLRPSPYVPDKPIVCNVAHVLAHAIGMEKQSTKRTVVNPGFAAIHMQWVAECAARKRWVEAKKADWQKRRKERGDWMDSIATTQAQWDAYVEEARKVYKDAESYPIPERPTK